MTIGAIPLPPVFRVALLAVSLSLSAGAAYAQSQADGLSDRLDPETAAQVRSIIESAAAQGLPGEPLTAKALEGQSKGASHERIVLAVRNLAVDLAAARLALGTTASSSEIVAGAGALRTGASSEVLSRLKAARGTHSVLLPLATLTDLVANGVPVADAVELVLTLSGRGAPEADYRTLGANAGIPNYGPAGSEPAGAPHTPAISRPTGVTGPGALPPAERPNPMGR